MGLCTEIKGHLVFIDDEDLWLFNGYKWHVSVKNKGKVYLQRAARYGEVYFHRIIMACPKGKTVDHINGNSLDNRRENLRICSLRQNLLNKKKRKDGVTTKYIGVHYNKLNKNYRGQLRINNKRIEVGSFDTAVEAAVARDVLAKKYFGEYARLNFPEGVSSV